MNLFWTKEKWIEIEDYINCHSLCVILLWLESIIVKWFSFDFINWTMILIDLPARNRNFHDTRNCYCFSQSYECTGWLTQKINWTDLKNSKRKRKRKRKWKSDNSNKKMVHEKRWKKSCSSGMIQCNRGISEYHINDCYLPKPLWLRLPMGCALESNHFAIASNPLEMTNTFVRSDRCEPLPSNGCRHVHLCLRLARFSALDRLTNSTMQCVVRQTNDQTKRRAEKHLSQLCIKITNYWVRTISFQSNTTNDNKQRAHNRKWFKNKTIHHGVVTKDLHQKYPCTETK